MIIALLQCDFTVGDVRGNAARIRDAVARAAVDGADLCLCPELALTGYPPRDLLLDAGFVDWVAAELRELAQSLDGAPATLLGFPERNPATVGNPVYNSVALVEGGVVRQTFRKQLLPTYDVFDERRYFEPGEGLCLAEIKGRRVGVTVCEDVWNDKDFWRTRRRYANDPVEALADAGLDLLVNVSASPFTLGKQQVREAMLSGLAAKYAVRVAYVNQVGGNDDLIFDGRSMVFGPDGRLLARARGFDEDVLPVELDAGQGSIASDDPLPESQAWRALVLGTRDYLRKSGFSRALLGLSGGIDSSLSAAIAVEAMGPANVTGVLMPSPYSSQGSVDDALALARNLGMDTLTLPIAGLMAEFERALAPAFAGLPADVTEENIQSRIRGNLLMALSNKFNAMLLTTGNKSELSVGYCTIYGDMAGGLAVIGDLPKDFVYRLAVWYNARHGERIPRAVLDKPPSAELRPGQLDQDSLPPYNVLDAILERRIERHESPETIVDAGFRREDVERVLRLVKSAEFKRRQAPPCLKVTDRAFGTGWRMPIARGRDWRFSL